MAKRVVVGAACGWFAATAAACAGSQAASVTAEPPASQAVVVPAAPPPGPEAMPAAESDAAKPEEPVAPPVAPDTGQPPRPQPSAEDLAKARDLFRNGVEAYTQGRWQEARDAFEAAYAIAPKAPVLYNLARVEQKLGNAKAACEHLEAYVRQASPPPSRLQALSGELQKCGIRP